MNRDNFEPITWAPTLDVLLSVTLCCTFATLTAPYFEWFITGLVVAGVLGMISLVVYRHANEMTPRLRDGFGLVGLLCATFSSVMLLPALIFCFFPLGWPAIITTVAWFVLIELILMERGLSPRGYSYLAIARSIMLVLHVVASVLVGSFPFVPSAVGWELAPLLIMLAAIICIPRWRTKPEHWLGPRLPPDAIATARAILVTA